MRLSRPFACAGAALFAAGLGVAAFAETPGVHVLRVALPDGSVRLVRYTGDVAPRIVLVRTPALDTPFAGLDRIAAMMDAQAAAMMRWASAMATHPVAAGPGGAVRLAAAPAGVRYTTTTMTVVNGRACTTTMQAMAPGAGRPPRLLRRVSGDGCTGAAARSAAPAPTALPAPPHVAAPTPKTPAPDTI